MSREIEQKRHIDCNWLTETKKGVFKCYDARSRLHHEDLTFEDVMQKACEFFHPQKEHVVSVQTDK